MFTEIEKVAMATAVPAGRLLSDASRQLAPPSTPGGGSCAFNGMSKCGRVAPCHTAKSSAGLLP